MNKMFSEISKEGFLRLEKDIALLKERADRYRDAYFCMKIAARAARENAAGNADTSLLDLALEIGEKRYREAELHLFYAMFERERGFDQRCAEFRVRLPEGAL